MEPFKYNFVREFTDCPGGRYKSRSEKSGEEFRQSVLEPLLAKYAAVELDLNGAFGFPPSFLDEAFGALIRKLGKDTFMKRVKIELSDDDMALRTIAEVISKNSSA